MRMNQQTFSLLTVLIEEGEELLRSAPRKTVSDALPGGGILIANSVKRDYEKRFGEESGVRFFPRDVDLKGFGKETLFNVATPALVNIRMAKFQARKGLGISESVIETLP